MVKMSFVCFALSLCMACANPPPPQSVTIETYQLSTGHQVWFVQKEPGVSDKVILCKSSNNPVCQPVWDGYRSDHQEVSLPENPYK